jgi:tRNA1Val (adenine37-N6)-methyltransferase
MFHFKKFSIDDSTAAMKIGTDAVLLGAWVPGGNETRILDIGTGTGILALMMAQRNNKTEIDAVEIDYHAANLAYKNVQLSPWPEQVHIVNMPVQEFSIKEKNKYSLIISNPPFFTDSLKAPDKARSIARHNDTLPVRDLLKATSQLLTEKGRAAFIFPADAYEKWTSEASVLALYPTVVTRLKSSQNHQPHRILVVFARDKESEISENELSIYISKNVYSPEYRELTKEFYLNF